MKKHKKFNSELKQGTVTIFMNGGRAMKIPLVNEDQVQALNCRHVTTAYSIKASDLKHKTCIHYKIFEYPQTGEWIAVELKEKYR